MELNELIEKYLEVCGTEKSIKEQKEQLGALIKEKMNELGCTEFATENGVECKLIGRTTYKYTDEVAIMQYIKEHDLGYIEQKISTKFNTELKKHGTLFEDCKNFITEEVSQSVAVK